MAKKPKISKTQAVRDYLKDHPGAMNVEIAAALNKQGIKITPGHVATIKTKINKTARCQEGGEESRRQPSEQQHRQSSRSRRRMAARSRWSRSRRSPTRSRRSAASSV